MYTFLHLFETRDGLDSASREFCVVRNQPPVRDFHQILDVQEVKVKVACRHDFEREQALDLMRLANDRQALELLAHQIASEGVFTYIYTKTFMPADMDKICI